MKGSVAQQTNSELNHFSSSVLDNVPFSARGPRVEDAVHTDHHSLLESIHDASEPNTFVKCLRSYKKVGAITYEGHIYGSSMSRRLKASNIFAKHPTSGYRAARIIFVFIKWLSSQQKITEQICAAVSWYDIHPEHRFCKPAMVFCKDFESEGFVSSRYWL